MTNLCMICGNRIPTNVCNCGCDASKNYYEKRTLCKIADNTTSLYKQRKKYDDGYVEYLLDCKLKKMGITLTK